MTRINKTFLKLQIWKDTSGQDLVEYALAAGLVAVAAVACMPGLSGTVDSSPSLAASGPKCWQAAAASASTAAEPSPSSASA